MWPPTPHYVFAVAPSGRWQEVETAAFEKLLDAALTRESAGYRRARSDGRIAAPAVLLLDPEAFHRDWHLAIGSGIRPTQVKDRLFRQDDTLWRRLTGPAPA